MFVLKPILDTMIAFYELPRTPERFNRYLELLRGNTKDDLVLPVGGFNPMAKEHIMEKLQELKTLQIEKIMTEITIQLNSHYHPKAAIEVVFNLADDLHGGWTNRFSTDYSSKFKLNALVQRNFCTPFFWTSEIPSERLIRERTREYLLRTLFWKTHSKPQTLNDFFNQEQFVMLHASKKLNHPDMDQVDSFLKTYGESDEETVIFNFFYGDEASESLGYPCYGIKTSWFED